jgi:outer membrane protein OmpA-like peptidoglycan-associated protein
VPPPTSVAVPDDGDHVVGEADRCADEPEDQDGFQDGDGCPDPDNDRDAILDIDDLCPCEVEDRDGWEDADGCPDPDNDGDRIVDVCDACPNEAEVYNGTCDGDGCPDRGYVLLSETRIQILDFVRFGRGVATPEPTSEPLLDAIAAALEGNPQITLVAIVGEANPHEPHRQGLAQRRAEVVLEALVQRGVVRERLVAEADPAPAHAPTDAPETWRRVRFDIRTIDGQPMDAPTEAQPYVPPPDRDDCFVPACNTTPPAPPAC